MNMNINRFSYIYVFLLVFVMTNESAFGQTNDYLTIPEIKFLNRKYILKFSSHPTENYYKQEYLVDGDNLTSYESMAIIDLSLRNSVENAIKSQVQYLNQRQKTDQLCNYKLLKSVDQKEYLLDFLISDKDSKGKVVIEWNVYKYSNAVVGSQNGVILFGVSYRAYDEESIIFMKSLPDFRVKILKSVSLFSLPPIGIQN